MTVPRRSPVRAQATGALFARGSGIRTASAFVRWAGAICVMGCGAQPNHMPLFAARAVAILTLSPPLATTGSDMGDIMAAEMASDGRLLIDYGTGSDVAMALIDRSTGGSLRLMFPRGGGPTEMANADAIHWTADGVVVFDRGQARLVTLDRTGQVRSEVAVMASVGWPTALDAAGTLYWLDRRHRDLTIRIWHRGRPVRDMPAGVPSRSATGTALTVTSVDTLLFFDSRDGCLRRLSFGVPMVVRGCLPPALLAALQAPRAPSRPTALAGRHVRWLTGMMRPHLLAFSTDSAALLLDTPSATGALGVVVRFARGTASLVYPAPHQDRAPFTIFTASVAGDGALLLSDGAELRLANISSPDPALSGDSS